MYLVQIFVVILGVFLHVTQPLGVLQPLSPERSLKINKEANQQQKNSTGTEHNDKKTSFVVQLEKTDGKIIKSVLTNANNSQVLSNNITSNQTNSINHNNITSLPKINQTLEETIGESSITSGAITRGILVFVVFSFLFVLYVGFKTCRRKSQDKRHTIVRKYGIRARRSDVEMEPLPLSDDDEDETVFDLTTSRVNPT